MVPLTHYLALGAILFLIGAAGVIMRRNAIMILLSIELMLNSVNITFVGFARQWADLTGQVFAIFVIAVAACEAAVGLAILISLNRDRSMVNVDEINLLKW
ncbi:MAG: NADH-quinone oxidoreductase subunit NuoK [Candidatus Tectomicrobia bacterium]|nr:NADH-quinone oxidoreductase subunit NuoK [Candidatus Tectomicrobia bacterium]MBI2178586.1 NADH-quinone oxidoreductase subunit NuoK [Candidatus Tectomicrobia bacterium]MBI3025915.1 NADH-quinone oxidoreductase subunit NuoK [Candidatus Tectomicrobia bacterium]